VNWIAIGALGCAASVAAGAFGAHGLRARLDADALALWETAARYLMYGSFGLMAIGLYERVTSEGGAGWAPALLATGVLIFSVTVGVLALGGPRWLGAVTPLGGVLMIVGLLMFAWTAVRG
jgi:uncharacterized membrane protein YgdD (TMEM256/DUF423 family)